MQTTKSRETLTRLTIVKMSTKGRSHRLRNALAGFGGGAGVGLIVGAVSDSGCPKNGCFPVGKNLGKVVFTPLGALIGVTIGALLPTGGVARPVSRKMSSLLSCHTNRSSQEPACWISTDKNGLRGHISLDGV